MKDFVFVRVVLVLCGKLLQGTGTGTGTRLDKRRTAGPQP